MEPGEESPPPEEKDEDRLYYGIGLVGVAFLVIFFALFMLRSPFSGMFGFFATLFLFAWILHQLVILLRRWRR
jgi:hypothetical protein